MRDLRSNLLNKPIGETGKTVHPRRLIVSPLLVVARQTQIWERTGKRTESHRRATLSTGNLNPTPCYTIVLPGRKSGFRAGFQPDSSQVSLKISTAAGRRDDLEAFLKRIRPTATPEAGNPARKHYCVT